MMAFAPTLNNNMHVHDFYNFLFNNIYIYIYIYIIITLELV